MPLDFAFEIITKNVGLIFFLGLTRILTRSCFGNKKQWKRNSVSGIRTFIIESASPTRIHVCRFMTLQNSVIDNVSLDFEI